MLIRSVATALALVMGAPALMGTAMAQDAAPTAEQAAPELLPDIVLGAEDAPLTVVEYVSFTCGFCADFHANSFPALKSEYIDAGKVRFIQRDVYHDELGIYAGVLARCGGDDKYYAVSGMLLDEQKRWRDAGSPEDVVANLRKIGLKAGMTEEQMDACWQDTAKGEQLIATFMHNAQLAGFPDLRVPTPTFLIGEDRIQNQSWDGLKGIIDGKLAAAE